jgi:hypothetical protein
METKKISETLVFSSAMMWLIEPENFCTLLTEKASNLTVSLNVI